MKYRLIREYPDSPELGIEIIKSHISNSSLGSYDTYMIKGEEWFKLPNPEKYPEFWELVVEKDYEILSYSDNNNNIFREKDNQGILHRLDFKIHSVKRNDSEIFTIGDKVSNIYDKDITIINKFEFNHDTININGNYARLSEINKSKQPIFQTEDGVDIFEGDNIYWINAHTLSEVNCGTYDTEYEEFDLKNGLISIKEFNKLNKNDCELALFGFSTKEKAEEYILMNKPCLTYKDIEEIITTSSKMRIDLLRRVKDKIKQKLNNNN